jgi:hypothetical protein
VLAATVPGEKACIWSVMVISHPVAVIYPLTVMVLSAALAAMNAKEKNRVTDKSDFL